MYFALSVLSTMKAGGADGIAPKPSSKACESDLNELKKLHIGFVLSELEIDWHEGGDYIYWDDKNRAKKANNGHWLWVEVDSKGETVSGGSAIDQANNGAGTVK